MARKDAAFFGLTLDLAEVLPDENGLWAEHLPAWTAWCAISGQWRTIPLSSGYGAKVIWLGLDYTAVRSGLELAGISITPECWTDVRLIEEGAIEELNRNVR